jgi:hypothetical protein
MGQLLIGGRDRQKFLSIFMERRRNPRKTLFRPRPVLFLAQEHFFFIQDRREID